MEIFSTLSALFLITSVVIIITPGQDMVLVMSRSITQGKGAGVLTALGVSTGLMGHTLLATFGLGALLVASETLFTIIKFIGAGYLIYIGTQLLISKEHTLGITNLSLLSYKKMYMQGVFSNISNPKITIFFFSYMPQFVTPNGSSETLQLFLLGTTFAILTFLVKGPIGYIAGLSAHYIKTHPSFLGTIHKTSGTILIALGIKLALEKRG